MKTKLTLVKKRTNFQMRVDDNFQKHLDELATMDGISASDVIRILVHREHAARFNGNHPVASTVTNGEAGSVPTKEEKPNG